MTLDDIRRDIAAAEADDQGEWIGRERRLARALQAVLDVVDEMATEFDDDSAIVYSAKIKRAIARRPEKP